MNCAVDDPESATSSEEDEPLPGVAAALTASTPPLPRPAVPLGADFGMSERQREKERKEGGRIDCMSATGREIVLRMCLVFAVDDSDSYLSEEENEEEPSLPGAALATSTPTPPQPAVPLGADFGECVCV